MNNIFEMLLNSIISSSMNIFVCSKLSKSNLNFKDYKLYIFFILLNAILLLNYFFINSYVKVALITLILILGLKYLLQYETRKAIVTGFLFQVLTFFAELIFSISLFLLFKNDAEFFINDFIGLTMSNLVIGLITLFLSYISFVKKIYIKLLSVTNRIKNSGLITVSFILIISVNLFLAIPYYEIDTLYIVLMNAGMISIYSFIVFKFIENKNRYIEISDKYNLSETSLKDLQSNINRLMTVNHENKNQWLTIRTMVANKDKNVLKHIDTIIDEKVKDDKYLKEKTSVIANTMLGSLVYSKLLDMKDKNINCEFHIDKQITKLNFINVDEKTNVDICKIIGTYLDNAIEATLETDKKVVSVDIYLDEEFMIISISNTFNGNIDLQKISEPGYTTKSDGHGYGLTLVKEILKDNDCLSSETEIINDIFIQMLKIKM